MIENKLKLLIYISTQLNDEQCEAVLARIEGNPIMRAREFFAIANEWEESKHPRHDDGRFAPGGSGRVDMHRSEADKWDKIGHGSPTSKEITHIKSEIRKLEKQRDASLTDIRRDGLQGEIVKKQRELAEAQRDEKKRRRLDLEHSVSSRVLKKKVAQFHDLEDEIDYMEERYADRNPNSPTQDEVVFPKSKAGEKARQKYEELKKRRDELDAEIDWDRVEEEDEG